MISKALSDHEFPYIVGIINAKQKYTSTRSAEVS